ncbi:RING finger protein 37-like [Ornithodoros turicata]|uniref:RING finger protein 37-like n=1 Tax=Ornithodoros turicata TaxID=34597 RepID=UPI00313959B0
MAINFTNEALGTSVHTDQVCTDDYEVQNLVRNNSSKRRNGFMAEYFIKPPVSVVFCFPVALEIHCIRLGLQRGPVRLTGFEVWTSQSETTEDFAMSARRFDVKSSEVVLNNRQYRPRGPFLALNLPSINLNGCETSTMKPIFSRGVRRLKIRLLRAEGSTAVGLQSCDVWGQPMSSSCGLGEQKDLIQKFLLAAKGPQFQARALRNRGTSPTPASDRVANSDSVNGVITQESVDIPSDFQDALTYELMVQPVLLPSGQVIDQSTLDRHVQAEGRWCRQPTDPFTGVELRGQNAPKFLPELKARIDQFVIKNVSELGNCPRTVGKGSGIRSHASVVALGLAVSNLSQSTRKEVGEAHCSKRKRETYEEGSKMAKYGHAQQDGSESAGTSHEDKVAMSLQSSIEETLKEIRNLKPKPTTSQLLNCKCGARDPSYKLPCEHYMCRTCLTKTVTKGEGQCYCKVQFVSSEVVRVHTAMFNC